MKKTLTVSIFAICLSLFSCRDSAKNYPVQFINRSEVFSPDKKPNPLMLVVGITEDGKLSLNKIEIGTIEDLTILNEKLNAIFDDRERAGIAEKEVIIDRQEKVKNEDLEKLIESLAAANASPIRIIKNDL